MLYKRILFYNISGWGVFKIQETRDDALSKFV